MHADDMHDYEIHAPVERRVVRGSPLFYVRGGLGRKLPRQVGLGKVSRGGEA
jgi:hypothetical protein